MITVGLILFAASLWWTSTLGPEWGFSALLGPQLLRGFAVMLCIVPSVGLALNGFAMVELRYASALFNLMRNLGGAIGIAVVNTWLQDGARIESARLGEGLGVTVNRAPDLIAGLTARFEQIGGDANQALLLAQGEFGRIVGRQALTIAFDEVFRQMAWMFLAALAMVPFCRPAPNTAPAVEAH